MASPRFAITSSVLACLALLQGCAGDGSGGNVNVPDTEAPTVRTAVRTAFAIARAVASNTTIG